MTFDFLRFLTLYAAFSNLFLYVHYNLFKVLWNFPQFADFLWAEVMETQSNPVFSPQSSEEIVREGRLGSDSGVSHVDQILGECLILQVIEVRDDDGDEEIDHRNSPKEDQGDEYDHGKGSCDVIIFN